MSDRKDTLQKAIVKNGIIDLGYGSAGGGTFAYCTNLKSIILPNGLMYIKQACFEGCKSLTNISLPDSVISIDNAAFPDCSSLVNITIPEGVTSIYSYTFSDCSSLASITIPESVTSIEPAFYNCSSLTNITYNGTQSQWNKISKKSTWKIDSSIKTITCTDGVITL